MDYLWYSEEYVRNIRRSPEKMIMEDFNGRTREVKSSPFVIYLDDDGEPHKVTCVTHNPEHGMGWKDTYLVAKAEKATFVCSGDTEIVTEAARKFCEAKSLEPSLKSILDYIEVNEKLALRSALKVRRPLKFGSMRRQRG